ncbi:hypothetical protein OQA88_956 [Cercophora sp. LCS_1]
MAPTAYWQPPTRPALLSCRSRNLTPGLTWWTVANGGHKSVERNAVPVAATVAATQIVATSYFGITAIIAFVPGRAEGAAPQHQLHIISPAYKPLKNAQTHQSCKNVSWCRVGTATNLYYIGTSGGATKAPFVLKEYDLEKLSIAKNNASALEIPLSATLGPDSDFAVYYDAREQRRYVIFTDVPAGSTDKVLKEVSLGTNNQASGPPKEIQVPAKSIKATALAVAVIPTTTNPATTKVALYYVSADGSLMRVLKSGGAWGASAKLALDPAVSISDSAPQIAASYVNTSEPSTRGVWIYFAKKGAGGLESHIDTGVN